METKTPLYFDALNWLGLFWSQRSGRACPWRELERMRRRVTDFVRAANESSFSLTVVIDDTSNSPEAIGKWRTRREKELRKDNRNMPLGIDALYAEAFEACGVRVLRPKDTDADDVLAALAAQFDGVVVSMDADFFRYVPVIRVSRSYRVIGRRLVLAEGADIPEKKPGERVSHRAVDLELAALDDQPSSWTEGCLIQRGVSSSSDRRSGSLHVLSTPLLAAVLHTLGVSSLEHECISWDDSTNKPVWTTTTICSDPACAELLRDVPRMVRWLEEKDTTYIEPGWRRVEREFNRRVVAADMYAKAFGGSLTSKVRRTGRWR